MHPLLAGADTIEHSADGIGNAAEEQQQKSRQGQNLQNLLPEGDYRPAHADVADHGKTFVFFQVDTSKSGCNGHHAPLEDQQSPGKLRVDGPQSRQHDHRVGAGNEEINGAVVDDLHHPLAHIGLQAMVYAGDGKHGDDAGAIDGRCNNAPDVTMQCCPDHKQDQPDNTQSAANYGGDHIHDLLTPGVVGKLSVR